MDCPRMGPWLQELGPPLMGPCQGVVSLKVVAEAVTERGWPPPQRYEYEYGGWGQRPREGP